MHFVLSRCFDIVERRKMLIQYRHYTPTPVICGCASESGTINATILFSFACCIIRIFVFAIR